MPGTVTHLAIADAIYEELGNRIIKSPPLFYGGNIAPDAVHARAGYQRADEVNNGGHRDFLQNDPYTADILAYDYPFEQT